MVPKRFRTFVAGLVAFLIGVPLSERAFGQVGDLIGGIIDSSIYASEGGS